MCNLLRWGWIDIAPQDTPDLLHQPLEHKMVLTLLNDRKTSMGRHLKKWKFYWIQISSFKTKVYLEDSLTGSFRVLVYMADFNYNGSYVAATETVWSRKLNFSKMLSIWPCTGEKKVPVPTLCSLNCPLYLPRGSSIKSQSPSLENAGYNKAACLAMRG